MRKTQLMIMVIIVTIRVPFVVGSNCTSVLMLLTSKQPKANAKGENSKIKSTELLVVS